LEILHIENLSFSYPNSKKPALENINLSVNRGEFIVVCGESGCGKTTLLKLLKKELAPYGRKSGRIFYNGIEQDKLDKKAVNSEIGYVLQNPDSQIVTDKVWHELAFGLENMGLDSNIIRRRVGEMASYFGIQDWFRKNTDELSGGQKQLLNLASIMVMQPKILILDEPTSQLDPIAAADFIATLQKLNRELGLTILLVEHRLEEVFPIADRVLMMDSGKVLLFDTPRNIGRLLPKEHNMVLGLPSAVRIFNALSMNSQCPLTVKEGRDFIETNFERGETEISFDKLSEGNLSIELKDVFFRYEKDSEDILRGTSLKIRQGEFFCLLGGNGTGKSTTLNVISGLSKPYRGKVIINGKSIKDHKGNSLYRNNLAFLPQNPQTVFMKDTVKEELEEILTAKETPKKEIEAIIKNTAEKFGISHLLDMHPYDLSGGEQQKCAMAKVSMTNPKILLLDEPTKGLDAHSKKRLSEILQELNKNRITVFMVTHDIEFAAENADRCALFFDGEILSADIPEIFFAENNFYTTAANRMARKLYPNAVTCQQVIECCEKYPKKEVE